MPTRRGLRVRKARARARRIRAQAETFLLLGCLICSRSALRNELLVYRARVRQKVTERVWIAQACMGGLDPSIAMKLLNATLEEERTV